MFSKVLMTIFLVTFLISVSVSAQTMAPTQAGPSEPDPESTENFFLDLLSHYDAFEDKGNTAAAQALYNLEDVRKKIHLESLGVSLQGQVQPAPNKDEVLVRYPSLGLVSIHKRVEDKESFTLNCGTGRDTTFTETAQGPLFGSRSEGLFLIYGEGRLWYIGSNLQVPKQNNTLWLGLDWVQKRFNLNPHMNQGGLMLHNGPSLEWDHQYNQNEIRNGGAFDDQGNEPWTYYWLNSNVKWKGSTKNGNRIGLWELFYPTGEKNAEFAYDDTSHITHYQGWYETGEKFCEGDTASTDFDGFYADRIMGEATEKYWDKNGKPLYGSFGSPEKEGDPIAVIYWPNGNPAVKSYPSLGTCGPFNFELFDPSGKSYFVAQSLGSPGAHGLGCSQKIAVTKTHLNSKFPDGPMVLGEWNIGSEILYKPIFCPVLKANFKNGKLDGQLTLQAPNDLNDSVGNIFGAPFAAIFSLKNGILDGKSIVGGIGLYTYEFKKGKLVQERSLEADERNPSGQMDYLKDVLNGVANPPEIEPDSQ